MITKINVMISAARNGDVAETSFALKGEWTSDAAVQEVRKRVHEYDALCKVAEAARILMRLATGTFSHYEVKDRLIVFLKNLDSIRAKEGK